MRKIIAFTVLNIIIIIHIFGCTGDGPNSIPEATTLIFQQNPSWSDPGIMYFYNAGITSYGIDRARVNDKYRGIVRYNINQNEYSVVLQYGITPYVCTSNDLVVCQYQNVSGPIYIINHGVASIVDENENWGWRVDPCINYDGTYYAWESRDIDHNAGIWIYNVNDSSYYYIGAGAFPVWKKNCNTIMFRRINDDNNSELIEYNSDTLEYSVVYTIPVDSRYLCGDYSPDDSKVVYCSVASSTPEYAIVIIDILSKSSIIINHHYAKGLSWGIGGIVYGNGCRDIDNNGCGVLWIINPSTLEYRQLTERLQFTGSEYLE